jgi:GNAT superfamily N-acetyltransferase
MTTVCIRPASIADRPYLLGTIRDTLSRNSAYCQGLHPEAMNQLLEPVLATFDAAVVTPTNDQNTILAFIVWREKVVAFLYVRARLRRKGFAAQLLKHAAIAPGPLDVPFMVTKIPGGSADGGPAKLPDIARRAGFELHFRPYIPLQIASELLSG